MSVPNANTIDELVEVVRSIPDASRSIRSRGTVSKTKLEAGEGLPVVSGEEEDYSHGDFGQWGQEFDEAVKSQGTDALAYYVSFHDTDRYSKRNWGIFIKESGVRYLAAKFQASFPPKFSRVESPWAKSVIPSWPDAVIRAYQALLFHEVFHFAADCMVARWESLLRAPCWAAHHDSVQAAPPGYDPLEEALANAHMYRQCGKDRFRGLRRWLRSLIHNSPQGYNEALDHVDEQSFAIALDDLSRRYIGLPMSRSGLAMSGCLVQLHLLYQLEIDKCATLCPIHLVRDAKNFRMAPLGLSFITRLPAVSLTKRFNKMLRKCPLPVQHEWQDFYHTCSTYVPRPPKFKKFKSVFALSLGGTNGGYRAHLRPIKGFANWEALEIGDHLTMGHGK